MATIKAVIVPAKALKDNRHKVRISVAHNGETRYIVTDIVVSSEKEFKNGQVVKRQDAALLNTKIRGLMQKCQLAIDEIECANCLSCSELIACLKNAGRDKMRTMDSVFSELLEYSSAKDSSKFRYADSYKMLARCVPGRTLVANISHSTVLAFDLFLRKRKLKPATLRLHMSVLRLIINYAKRCGYAEYRQDPFCGYSLPAAGVRQSWLTVDEVRLVRDFKTKGKSVTKARDMFMLSYYLGGINMADLVRINFGESGSTLRYVRKKTEKRQKLNQYVEFSIPEEAKAIIAKYKGRDGRLAFTEPQRANSGQWYMGYHMAQLAKATGLSNLIYYSARKSFSQHAFALGVSTSVIDYILGHTLAKGSSCLYSYISVTPELATNAIRKVLDNLK